MYIYTHIIYYIIKYIYIYIHIHIYLSLYIYIYLYLYVYLYLYLFLQNDLPEHVITQYKPPIFLLETSIYAFSNISNIYNRIAIRSSRSIQKPSIFRLPP